MSAQPPDLAAVVVQVERLEREWRGETRRKRWLLVAVGLGLVGVVLAWTLANTATPVQAQGSKEIRANQFTLEDENGKPRVTLTAAKAGPSLSLHDESSRARVALRLDKDGPVVSLACENGKTIWMAP